MTWRESRPVIDLVARAQHGDREAFATLVGAAADRLYAAAFLVVRDRSRAEDAVQEALIRCWRELPTLRDPARFEAWARRVVVRAAIDEARRARAAPHITLVADVAGTYVEADLLVARDTLERAFGRLTPEHRAALVLRHYLSLSVPEIAEALGIPDGTAKSRLHHATQAMRAAIEADERATQRSNSA